MRLGLGTGSTAAHFVDCIGEKARDGLDVICVPTSERTRLQAESWHLRLSTLDETPELDLTVDGADEFDSPLRLIKGGGGALLREKIVAAASKRMVVITDASKEVAHARKIQTAGRGRSFSASRRRNAISRRRRAPAAAPARSCSANSSVRQDLSHRRRPCDLRLRFPRHPRPDALAVALNAIPGVVEHGLFIGIASAVIIADTTGIRVVGKLEG